MPKINVTNRMNDYFDLGFVVPNSNNQNTTSDKLRTYFGHVVKGNDEVYDTPFAKGESTSSLLNAWNQILVSISDKWPSLYEFESDLRSKVGPLSVMKPLKDRITDVEEYYKGIHLPGVPIEPWAVWDVMHEWQKAKGLRFRGEEKTILNMKLSTNSGAPYFSKRRLVRSTTGYDIDAGVHGMKVSLHQRTWEGYGSAVIGWRGQEGGPSPKDVKQRVVWMFPYGINVLELGVYQPLIESAQRFNFVPAWVSMDEVDKGVTRLFDTKGRNDLIVCTDFTKFDQHFNQYLQSAANEILEWLLTDNADSRNWLKSVFPIKYMIPIFIDWGQLYIGTHGMASGSGGTNADETLAHRALQYEAAGLHKAILNPNSMCLGDDGILSYPGITSEDVTDSYSSHGLEMNKSKQYESAKDCTYLRRWHHQDYRQNGICVGVYSTFRALGRLRYLERYYDPEVWSSKAVALRQLSIIENCKFHPLKEQFVQFCMKRDKYRLGIDIPEFLPNIEREARELIDYMPDFLGYTKTLQAGSDPSKGISEWWIVKYLKSLS